MSALPSLPAGDLSAPIRITILQGEAKASTDPRVEMGTILGSCVATCLFDPVARVGGMNHFLLAEPPASQASLFKGIALQSYAEALERWQARPPDLASILNEAATRLKAALELLPNDPELAEMATVIEILSTD